MFSAQNPRKQTHNTQGMFTVLGASTFTIAKIACPPIHD